MATLLVHADKPMGEAAKSLRKKLIAVLLREAQALSVEQGDVATALSNLLAEWMGTDLVGLDHPADLKVVEVFLVKRFAAAYNDAKKLVTA